MRIEPRSSAPDEELVAELRASGSESAFRDLHRRHTPRLLALILRMLGGADADAEDLVQETWIRAVESISAFRGEAQFGTWLVRIGIHVSQDFLKRARPVLVSLDGEAGPFARDPMVAERLDLERVIACLPDGYRTVLLLHDVEGFTHAEIGEMLGIAEGTSKSQLNAARRQAQALFEGRSSCGAAKRAAAPGNAGWTEGEERLARQ